MQTNQDKDSSLGGEIPQQNQHQNTQKPTSNKMEEPKIVRMKANSQKYDHPRLHVMRMTHQIRGLQTIIRNHKTPRDDFIFYSDRLLRLVIEEGLGFLPFEEKVVITPTGEEYHGVGFVGKLCGVSIIRAGESMESALREVCQDIRIGKILIQRNEETAKPVLHYVKLPHDISERYVLLLDPMLATGGSAIQAIDVLRKHGVPDDKIIFVNLISCPEGIAAMKAHCPEVTIVTSEVDERLNEKKYILPGIGDFGDRYFGTT